MTKSIIIMYKGSSVHRLDYVIFWTVLDGMAAGTSSLSISMSVFLSVCLPISLCLSDCLSVSFSLSLSLSLSLCRSVSVLTYTLIMNWISHPIDTNQCLLFYSSLSCLSVMFNCHLKSVKCRGSYELMS